jgi:SAM-dependent methyltransferase
MELPLPKAGPFEQRLRNTLANSWLNPFYTSRRFLWRGLGHAAHFAEGALLDVGCGKKPYKPLFRKVKNHLGIEVPSTVSRSRVIDVYGNGERLPFEAGSFDTVLCTETIEHTPEPKVILRECFRVLKTGGYMLLSTPQTWGLHEAPYDYYRYTEYGLKYLAQTVGFEVVQVYPTCGVFATVGQRLSSAVYYLLGYRKWLPIQGLVVAICAVIQLGGVVLDRLTGHWGDTLDNILVARKN